MHPSIKLPNLLLVVCYFETSGERKAKISLNARTDKRTTSTVMPLSYLSSADFKIKISMGAQIANKRAIAVHTHQCKAATREARCHSRELNGSPKMGTCTNTPEQPTKLEVPVPTPQSWTGIDMIGENQTETKNMDECQEAQTPHRKHWHPKWLDKYIMEWRACSATCVHTGQICQRGEACDTTQRYMHNQHINGQSPQQRKRASCIAARAPETPK